MAAFACEHMAITGVVRAFCDKCGELEASPPSVGRAVGYVSSNTALLYKGEMTVDARILHAEE